MRAHLHLFCPCLMLHKDRRLMHRFRKTCPIELERHARLLQITSHGYAMADDEIMFQLQHIAACQSDANPRQFIVLPPLHLIQWLHGDGCCFA